MSENLLISRHGPTLSGFACRLCNEPWPCPTQRQDDRIAELESQLWATEGRGLQLWEHAEGIRREGQELVEAAEGTIAALVDAMQPLLQSFDAWCHLDHQGVCQSHLMDKPCSVVRARHTFKDIPAASKAILEELDSLWQFSNDVRSAMRYGERMADCTVLEGLKLAKAAAEREKGLRKAVEQMQHKAQQIVEGQVGYKRRALAVVEMARAALAQEGEE